MKLTKPQRKVLEQAAADKLGLVPHPHRQSFGGTSFDKMLARLRDEGLVGRYVHGGFVITDAGRAALGSPN